MTEDDIVGIISGCQRNFRRWKFAKNAMDHCPCSILAPSVVNQCDDAYAGTALSYLSLRQHHHENTITTSCDCAYTCKICCCFGRVAISGEPQPLRYTVSSSRLVIHYSSRSAWPVRVCQTSRYPGGVGTVIQSGGEQTIPDSTSQITQIGTGTRTAVTTKQPTDLTARN